MHVVLPRGTDLWCSSWRYEGHPSKEVPSRSRRSQGYPRKGVTGRSRRGTGIGRRGGPRLRVRRGRRSWWYCRSSAAARLENAPLFEHPLVRAPEFPGDYLSMQFLCAQSLVSAVDSFPLSALAGKLGCS